MRYTLLIVCSLIITSVIAQDSTSFQLKHKIGFDYGYGSQYKSFVNYEYNVHLFQFQYYYPILNKTNYTLEILTQPQFNFVTFEQTPNTNIYKKGIEFGVNAGILIRKYISRSSNSVYAFLSSGPHYVTGAPDRQVTGFIFSDNLLIGLSLKITSNLYLDFRTGIRHISNANINHPNGGVNIFENNIGFTIPLK